MVIATQLQQEGHITTSKIERILYTTDLAKLPDEAMEYAIMLALSFDARLSLCHCLNFSEKQDYENEYRHIQSLYEKAVGACVSPTIPPKLKWDGVITMGETTNAVSVEACVELTDLIVMQSRRRPYRSALLGSIAESICYKSGRPVLFTHAGERSWVDGETESVKLNRILVATDFSEQAKLALSFAITFAAAFGSQLHLLHVLPYDQEANGSPLFGNPTHLTNNRLEKLVSMLDYRPEVVESVVMEGKPSEQILAYANKHEIDLICIGSHGKEDRKESIFGSTTELVSRNALCPILVAQ